MNHVGKVRTCPSDAAQKVHGMPNVLGISFHGSSCAQFKHPGPFAERDPQSRLPSSQPCFRPDWCFFLRPNLKRPALLTERPRLSHRASPVSGFAEAHCSFMIVAEREQHVLSPELTGAHPVPVQRRSFASPQASQHLGLLQSTQSSCPRRHATTARVRQRRVRL